MVYEKIWSPEDQKISYRIIRDFLFVIGRKWHILFMSHLFSFFFYMALPNGRRLGETRVDPADGLKYRWTGSAWIVDGTGTPSSAGFANGRYINDEREDKATGRKYSWNGSSWVLIDINKDGWPDVPAASVGTAELKYSVRTVTITAATSGTATGLPTKAQILGYHVSAVTGTSFVKSAAISGTTLTVTLSASDTATVRVIVLEPVA